MKKNILDFYTDYLLNPFSVSKVRNVSCIQPLIRIHHSPLKYIVNIADENAWFPIIFNNRTFCQIIVQVLYFKRHDEHGISGEEVIHIQTHS